MSDGLSLYQDLLDDRRLMKRAVQEASERGREYACAKAAYYAAKSAKALEMKAEGVPVTLIGAAVKGAPEVAGKLLDMQAAEALWRAAMKAVDVYMLDCRIVHDQIKRMEAGDPSYMR